MACKNNYFGFLKSNRFHAVLVFALASYLGAKGYLPMEAVAAIQTVTGAHVVIRSVDRNVEKLGK